MLDKKISVFVLTVSYSKEGNIKQGFLDLDFFSGNTTLLPW